MEDFLGDKALPRHGDAPLSDRVTTPRPPLGGRTPRDPRPTRRLALVLALVPAASLAAAGWGWGLESPLFWTAALGSAFFLFLSLSYLDALPRGRPWIEDVFLLHRSGILICHYSTALHDAGLAGSRETSEALSTSVVYALQPVPSGPRGFLSADHRVHTAQGQHTILVVFARGLRTRALEERMQTVLHTIEALYAKALDAWSGQPEDLRHVEDVLLSLVDS